MREIKFRAKKIEDNNWEYGSIVLDSMDTERASIISWADHGELKDSGAFVWDDVHCNTISQYTGLKDKNGKEAYHKDIVSSGKKLYIIEWQEKEARFILLPTGNNTSSWRWMDEIDYMAIIGNSFENPELLTPSK